MNRLIFDTLTFLNAFIAVLTIAACAHLGWNMPAFALAKPLGLLLGAGLGLIVAAVVCGLLAFLALVERHLRTIADRPTAAHASFGAAPTVQRERQEPRL